ncbi:MAG: nuclease domain-containing protein, partial [Verrucomicrobia bacterium]|nr:nuclease domain-containing protein [Verrucomicrobiota bacterium]
MGGGASGFDAGKKDLPALYEAWLFSQLFKLFCAKFGVSIDEKRKLLDENDPLNFVIKQGTRASFKGLKTSGHRNIQGEFSYNKSFGGNMDPRTTGSWTRILRPDFTMSFWPDGLDKKEAERTEQMVHIHFDAKYRVQSIDAIFGKEMDESSSESMLNEEKNGQREGNYNRADLLKMHAYRDAIRRSEGAYVLYPGEITSVEKDNKCWKGFHELLPGLGAFAIKPASDGSAKGIEYLGKFLDEVLALLANGVSFLEHRRQGTQHMAQTHEKWESDFGDTTPYILSELPGLLNDIGEGPNSSHTVSVLVGWCKDEDHLKWIEERGLYNVRLGEGVAGAVEILDP